MSRLRDRRRGFVEPAGMLLLGALAFGLSGCGSVGPGESLEAAQIRFVQVSPGSPPMDFYANGSGAAYGLGFASYTSYLPVSSGTATLGVTRAGTGQQVAQAQSAFSGGRQYTMVLSHGLGSLQERVYVDQDTPAPQGQVALRVINELEVAGNVNFYVVPNASAGSASPSQVMGLGAGSASGYVNLPAGVAYVVTATVAEGHLNVPIGSVNLKLNSGAVRTVVFAGTGRSGNRGVVGFVLEDANVP